MKTFTTRRGKDCIVTEFVEADGTSQILLADETVHEILLTLGEHEPIIFRGAYERGLGLSVVDADGKITTGYFDFMLPENSFFSGVCCYYGSAVGDNHNYLVFTPHATITEAMEDRALEYHNNIIEETVFVTNTTTARKIKEFIGNHLSKDHEHEFFKTTYTWEKANLRVELVIYRDDEDVDKRFAQNFNKLNTPGFLYMSKYGYLTGRLRNLMENYSSQEEKDEMGTIINTLKRLDSFLPRNDARRQLTMTMENVVEKIRR